MKILNIVVVLLVLFSTNANSAENISIAVDFKNKTNLNFEGNGEKVELSTYQIPFIFKDNNGGKKIEKILADPSYLPKKTNPGDADFWITTKVKAKASQELLHATALCEWNKSKKIAECGIECDGGRFLFIVISHGKSLYTSHFKIQIPKIEAEGRNGFRVGESETCSGYEIELKLNGSGPEDIPINFKK